MVSINVKDGEPFEKALRRFSKKMGKGWHLRDVKARSYYLKLSVNWKKIAKTKKRKRRLF